MQIAARQNLGFTLTELMMSLAVLAILMATAMPAFGNLVQSSQEQTARSALSAALGTARIAAVSRTSNVVVCPSPDQQYCGRTTEWQHGWLVFVDADHDGLRDASEELLEAAQAQPDGVAILSSTGRTRVNYQPDGSSPGTNITLTVCDSRGANRATALIINNAGRVRSGTPSAAAATACVNAIR